MITNLRINPWDSDTPKPALIPFCISLTEVAVVERVFLGSQDEAANPQAESASRGIERTDKRV